MDKSPCNYNDLHTLMLKQVPIINYEFLIPVFLDILKHSNLVVLPAELNSDMVTKIQLEADVVNYPIQDVWSVIKEFNMLNKG